MSCRWKWKNKQDEITNKKSIEEIVEARKIKSLIHFTHINNLSNIIKNGILSRESMENEKIDFVHTDDVRLDGYWDAISLSISYPNGKMLYKKRMDNGNNFIIIKLFPAILYKSHCAFCGSNAATNSVREIPLVERVTYDAFEDMFSLNPRGSGCTRNNNIPNNMPTDEQAEVLVFNDISPYYIEEIVFFSRADMKQYGVLCGNIKCNYDPSMFGIRDYYLR